MKLIINNHRVEFTTGFFGDVYISAINGKAPEKFKNLESIKESLTTLVQEDFLAGAEDRKQERDYCNGRG